MWDSKELVQAVTAALVVFAVILFATGYAARWVFGG